MPNLERYREKLTFFPILLCLDYRVDLIKRTYTYNGFTFLYEILKLRNNI